MKVLAPLMLLQLAGSAAAVCEDMQVDGKPWGESIGMSCDWHVGRQCAQADMPFGGKGYPTGREACCACKCENDPYMFGCPLFGTPKTAVPTPVPTTAVPETEAPVVCKNKDDHYCSYESFCKYGDYAADCPVLCDACPEPTPAPLCADVEGAEYCQRYSHFCKYDDFKVSCPATCGACPETPVPTTATPEPTPTPPAVNAALSIIEENGNTIAAVSGTIHDGFDGDYAANVDSSVTVVGTDCKITFTEMDVEASFRGYCRADYVRVMFGPDFKTGRRLCGDDLVDLQLRGDSFRVDFSTNSINNAGGFELAFSCAGDPATPAPTPVPAPCADKRNADGSLFHISAGARFNCGYFESRTADRCARFGGDRYAFDGLTAQEACCVCGGGVQ